MPEEPRISMNTRTTISFPLFISSMLHSIALILLLMVPVHRGSNPEGSLWSYLVYLTEGKEAVKVAATKVKTSQDAVSNVRSEKPLKAEDVSSREVEEKPAEPEKETQLPQPPESNLFAAAHERERTPDVMPERVREMLHPKDEVPKPEEVPPIQEKKAEETLPTAKTEEKPSEVVSEKGDGKESSSPAVAERPEMREDKATEGKDDKTDTPLKTVQADGSDAPVANRAAETNPVREVVPLEEAKQGDTLMAVPEPEVAKISDSHHTEKPLQDQVSTTEDKKPDIKKSAGEERGRPPLKKKREKSKAMPAKVSETRTIGKAKKGSERKIAAAKKQETVKIGKGQGGDKTAESASSHQQPPREGVPAERIEPQPAGKNVSLSPAVSEAPGGAAITSLFDWVWASPNQSPENGARGEPYIAKAESGPPQEGPSPAEKGVNKENEAQSPEGTQGKEREPSVGIPVPEVALRDVVIEMSVKEKEMSGVSLRLMKRPYPEAFEKRGTPYGPGGETQKALDFVEEKSGGDNAGGTSRIISVAKAEKGTYTLAMENGGDAIILVKLVFRLYERRGRERIKEYAMVELPSHGMVKFHFLLPDALFWDDEDRFSGSIEDSNSLTKFQYDTGLVWKEKKDH